MEKQALKLKEFLSESETLEGISFNGSYNMPYDDFFRLFDHFIKTGECLLDIYTNVTHLLWNAHRSDIIYDDSFYEKHLKYISNPLIQELFDTDELNSCYLQLECGYANFLKSKEIKKQSPERLIACKFTTRKDIRRYIFRLHGEKCLCCGSDEYISLDHIIPISKGGKNKVDNLQPLCKYCNSKKGSNIIDYRINGI